MATIANNTKAHQIFAIMGESAVAREYRTVVATDDGSEVVTHTVMEPSSHAVKTIIIPPCVPKDGLDGVCEISKEDLAQLKADEGFMAAVKARDVIITSHA